MSRLPAQVAGSAAWTDTAQESPVEPVRMSPPVTSRVLATSLLVLTDAVCFLGALALAFYARVHVVPHVVPAVAGQLPPGLVEHAWWMGGLFILCMAYQGTYSDRSPFWQETGSIIKASVLAFILVMTVVSVARLGAEVSRAVLALGFAFSLAMVPAGRYAGKPLLARSRLWVRPVVILGAGKAGRRVARCLLGDRYQGYEVVGFLEEDASRVGQQVEVQGRHFLVLGVFRDSKALMERTGATHMVVAAPNLEPNSLVGLVNRLHREGATVMLIPNLRGLPLTGMEVEYFFNEQMMSLRIRNNLASGFNRAMKRAFDLGVGSLILVAILPLMALVALAIKLDSPGPVTFAHRRIGRGGREFNCYKFRSMVVNADAVLQQVLDSDPALREEWERNFKLRRDPRVTRVGRLLRATSLDELPQIFNVLKGEMSLVGPRPIVASEVPRFSHYIADYYQVCPGMTGLWQVSGRSEIEYSSRIRLESWYIRNWSLWLDVSLLFRTIAVVLGKRGAY